MPKLTYDVSILAQLFNFVYMCVFIDHLECPFEWRIVSPMIRQYYNFPSTATCAVLMLSTLSPMDCAPPQVGCTVDIGWLVCGVAWCHPVCVGLHCCRRSVDCMWVLQFSVFCLFSSPPCSFSTPFCQRHYSQIYPVLSLLLSVLSVCRHWLVGVWCCLVSSCLCGILLLSPWC